MRNFKAVHMNNKVLMREPTYTPEAMLDAMIQRFNLKNDAALARALRVQAPIISKVRNHRAPISDTLLLRLHEASGMTIQELRELIGSKPAIEPIQKAA